MKLPSYSKYDQYFPIYTIERVSGTKSTGRVLLSVLQSETSKIVVSIAMNSGKIREIQIWKKNEFRHPIDDKTKYISWFEFATQIRPALKELQKNILSKDSSDIYFKSQYLPEVFKYNQTRTSLIEIDSDSIRLDLDPIAIYEVDNERGTVTGKYNENTGSQLLDNFTKLLSPLHIYKLIKEEQIFYSRFEYKWENYLPYFEAPKKLHKKEYALDKYCKF